MDKEIKTYLRLETTVSAAFCFFINGMIAALIYRKADFVPADTVSITADLTITCLLTAILSAYFSRASLRRTKAAAILDARNPAIRRLSRLFRRPALFGILVGFGIAVLFFVLIAPASALLGVNTVPFGLYFTLKTVFSALLGGGLTLLELYAGMHKP